MATKPATTPTPMQTPAPADQPAAAPSPARDIHTAILAVMGEVGYVTKSRTPNLTYSFAGEAALIAALRPAMVDHGIYMMVLQVAEIRRETYTTRSGTPMLNTFVNAVIRFTHAPSGTWIDVMATGEGSDTGDKSANKAMTGAYKYALRQTFCIETGDDPDKYPSDERAGYQPQPARAPAPAAAPSVTQLPIDSTTPAPMPAAPDNRIWTVAQKNALIEAGLAQNDFGAKGMLGLSNLPANATVEQVVTWGTIYRGERMNPDGSQKLPAAEAAKIANQQNIMKELGYGSK